MYTSTSKIVSRIPKADSWNTALNHLECERWAYRMNLHLKIYDCITQSASNGHFKLLVRSMKRLRGLPKLLRPGRMRCDHPWNQLHVQSGSNSNLCTDHESVTERDQDYLIILREFNSCLAVISITAHYGVISEVMHVIGQKGTMCTVYDRESLVLFGYAVPNNELFGPWWSRRSKR